MCINILFYVLIWHVMVTFINSNRCSNMGLFGCMIWFKTYWIGRGSTWVDVYKNQYVLPISALRTFILMFYISLPGKSTNRKKKNIAGRNFSTKCFYDVSVNCIHLCYHCANTCYLLFFENRSKNTISIFSEEVRTIC